MKPTKEQKDKFEVTYKRIRHKLQKISKKVTFEKNTFRVANDKWGSIAALNKVFADLVDIDEFL